MYVCMYVCTYTLYTHTHTHTHIYIYILDSSHEGINGSMSLLANRAARQSSQPLVVSQSSCKSVAAASRGWTMQPVEASRGIQSSHSVEAASRGQSGQPKIVRKSVPGGVGSPRAVPSVLQQREDSIEELIRGARERFQSSPGRPKSSQRRPDRASRAVRSGPK